MFPPGLTNLICLIILLSRTESKNDNLARLPLSGWNSWNWIGDSECTTTGRCLNEQVIREMADALVSTGMKDAGYTIINLSEGWPANTRLPNGSLQGDPIRFPSGIPALSEYVHSKGLEFGIYLDSGTKTCAGHPGSWSYEAIDVATITGLFNSSYLWLDCCYMPPDSNYTATYALWSKLLNESGHPIAWEASIPAYTPVNYNWVSSIAHEWRYYNDIRADFNEIMGIVDYTINNNILQYIRPGQYPLLDMMEVGNSPLTVAESRSHFSLWCIFAQPLHAGNDIRNMSSDILNILTNMEAIMIDRDPLVNAAYLVARINTSSTINYNMNNENNHFDHSNIMYDTTDQCNNWIIEQNGYNETCNGPSGNILCFNDTTLDNANNTCCNDPLCAGFSYNPNVNGGSGCYKRDMDCGFVSDPGYSGYTKPGFVPPSEVDIYARLLSDMSLAVLLLNRGMSNTTACVTWSQLNLNYYESVFVRDIWLHQDMGWYMDQYCASIPSHDVIFLRVHQ